MPAIIEIFENTIALPVKEMGMKNKKDIEVPIKISIFLLSGTSSVKAFVKINFCGFTLNDIRITEKRGSTSIDYPEKKIVHNKIEKVASIYHPYIADFDTKLNHLIINAYTEAAIKHFSIKKESVA